jgi:hypothetical protein
MSNKKIGYKNPPEHTRFKVGNNANPKGRPRRMPLAAAQIISDFLSQRTRYTERGRIKTATRYDLKVTKVANDAVKGDVKSAEMLLALWEHVKRYGGAGKRTLRITNWLPDQPGQTAEQKTQESSGMDTKADTPEWWKSADIKPTDDSSEK